MVSRRMREAVYSDIIVRCSVRCIVSRYYVVRYSVWVITCLALMVKLSKCASCVETYTYTIRAPGIEECGPNYRESMS